MASFQNNGKLKLLIIVVTRPEVIKKSRRYFDCLLAHTGQNYDYNLNGVFFNDLELDDPDIYYEIHRGGGGKDLRQHLSGAAGQLLQ